jgi:squalene-hopene/tetraprenyl-beta-curcumene cyclase
MKIPLLTALLFASTLWAEEPIVNKPEDASVRNEVQLALDKGLVWLEKQQRNDGSWGAPGNPALTALPTLALLHGPPSDTDAKAKKEALQKAVIALRIYVKSNGGIYEKGFANFNTALCLTALLHGKSPEDEKAVEAAQRYLVNHQAKRADDPEVAGGIGAGASNGSGHNRPDLLSTFVVMEALLSYRSTHPAVAEESEKAKDFDWAAAAGFASRCQHFPASNPAPWVSDDPVNRGGFVNTPGESEAGLVSYGKGKKYPRAFGSATYAGLMTLLYAQVPKDDPRIASALEWIKKTFTVQENPGVGRKEYYEYLHLLAKGLTVANLQEVETPTGRKIDWAREVALKLVNTQAPDGSWENKSPEAAHSLESDPAYTTAHALLALEIIYGRL